MDFYWNFKSMLHDISWICFYIKVSEYFHVSQNQWTLLPLISNVYYRDLSNQTPTKQTFGLIRTIIQGCDLIILFLAVWTQQTVWKKTLNFVKYINGFNTRFSCSLINWNLQRSKMMICPFYPIPSPTTGWTTWPMLAN